MSGTWWYSADSGIGKHIYRQSSAVYMPLEPIYTNDIYHSQKYKLLHILSWDYCVKNIIALSY